MNKQDLTLLTDLYELTMMQGYYKKGQHETVVFDVFYRHNPCGNGYSVCAGLDQVIDYIKSTGLNYYVGPFETAIEGDYDELMDIVKECQHIAVRAGAPSVAAYIKVSYKPEGDVLTIEKKVTKHHQ